MSSADETPDSLLQDRGPVANARNEVEWVEQNLEPCRDRTAVNPASRYTSPDEVLHDPTLSVCQKREILQNWAFDEYRIQVAMTEGMAPQGELSRLGDVIDALIDLDGGANVRAAPNVAKPSQNPVRHRAA